MKILITGGAGLIGREIAKTHIEHGDEVFIYDKRLNPYNNYTDYFGEDITNQFSSLGMMLSVIRPDVISHQAALVGVGQSQYKINDYVANNIGWTGELLQAIINTHCYPSKILFAGSMGPYGDGNSHFNEMDKPQPKSIYAVTKLAQEELIRVFSQTYKIPSVSLRYFSVYGTRQNPLNPYTGVLSVIANQILNNDVVEMYEDGGQTRDLVNVEDVADAHYLASLLDFSEFTAINIATGKMSRLDEVCKKMIEILCPDKKLIFNGKHRMGDVYEVGADNSLARKVLGWIPKHNIVDDIKVYCGYIHANRELFTVGNTIKQENEIITRYNLVRDTNGS